MDITMIDADDPAVSSPRERAARLLDAVQPNLLVRTTPTVGEGIDEYLVQVDRELGRRTAAVALQDCQGIGKRLSLGRADDAYRVLTVDERAAATVRARHGVAADAVGWLAHSRFLRGVPYAEARRSGRRLMAVDEEAIQVLFIGAAAEVEVERELGLVESMAPELRGLSTSVPVTYSYRPHPRRGAEELDALSKGVTALLDPLSAVDTAGLSYRETLASVDVVVSGASVMNLEVLAYFSAGSDGRARTPLSVYQEPREAGLFPGDWSAVRPLTHVPGNGSVLVHQGATAPPLEDLVLKSAMSRRRAREIRQYLPDPQGDALRASLRSVLQEGTDGEQS
ncbi:hypothetical protein ACIBAC_19265 [Streptomyces sp. NPDC051362]|uniref:hypothetical protein n=1 Tax=Streptomyces sp. NPDC051362 TaxID=3365651 RepID=UPI0037B99DD8